MNLPADTIISIKNPTKKEDSEAEINILCFNLTPYSQTTQFICCTVFVLVCYLTYGYFLELIFANPNVTPVSLYITLVQFLITMVLSYVESFIRSPIKRKVPLSTYSLLAALTLGTMAFSNLAISYLNYPTQLIFKSCKLIPVMIGSIIILNKKYGFLDYVAAILMCIGLTMFTLANSKTSPSFNIAGVFIISLALLCDAIIGNVQEKAMKLHQASNNEVVFFSYTIASGYLIVITLFTGVLKDGILYSIEILNADVIEMVLRNHLNHDSFQTKRADDFKTPQQSPITLYVYIALLSVSGYCGLQAVLTLVRISGATVAVTVTTMRKAVSIIISFLLFSKPFVFQYAWSGLLVVLAIYLNHLSKKHPNYTPRPVQKCWHYLSSYYKSEYSYLKMRSKMYSDTV